MSKSIDSGTLAVLQHSVGAGGVVVVERGDGRFTQVLLDGAHILLADEPKDVGGNDRGPSPYRLLLMALGACTSMTLRMYATRKGWPLERTTVRLRHFREYVKDCVDCATKDAHIEKIERIITLDGPLDDAQRERLLEIAEKCPVHRTLESKVSIVSQLAA